MSRLTLTIDGRTVSGRSGMNLLQAARTEGIAIPTLCSFPGLAPLGACRVCIVEVAGRELPLPACATPAEEGMVVTTSSERLTCLRRMTVELLLAERNHVCPVCTREGACELQALARALGIDHLRYEQFSPRLEVDLSHRRFGIDHNRCILCRRCVRVCDTVEGAHTLDVGWRGGSSRVICDLARPWGESSTCTECGKCVTVCPTGALFEKGGGLPRRSAVDLERIRSWRKRRFR